MERQPVRHYDLVCCVDVATLIIIISIMYIRDEVVTNAFDTTVNAKIHRSPTE